MLSKLRIKIAIAVFLLLLSCTILASEKAVITFEQPVCVDMPVWVHVKLPDNFRHLQANLRYPFSVHPWDTGFHKFQVVKDGRLLPRLHHIDSRVVCSTGLFGGSVAPSTSPTGRLPLHLIYRFDKPGKYLVRYEGHDYRSPNDKEPPRVYSDWTSIDVKPLSSEKRRAWQDQQTASAPGDAGKLVGDYLPSLLACPDDVVLRALLNEIHNPNKLVQNFALKGLYYYDDDVIRREIPRVIKEKGPTELLAYDLSWERALLQPDGEDIVLSVIPFLKSKSAAQVGAAVHSLLFLKADYDWKTKPDIPKQIEDAVWDAVPHIRSFKEREALWPLVLFMGVTKNGRARDLLKQLSEISCVREQALGCLEKQLTPL